jgi:hypothetical protein
MAIIQKIINPQPETVWFLEETGENYRSEQQAEQALKDYFIRLDREKKNCLINEVLFDCAWFKHYGENALVRRDLNKDGWFKQVDPSLKYDYSHADTRGVLNFWDVKNFLRLMGTLIKDGVEVTFIQGEEHSGFITHDCQPGIVIGMDQNNLAFESELNDKLVISAFEYCEWLRGQK